MLLLCNSYMYTRVKRESSICVFVQPHVLATLDRTHRPENVERAVSAARAAGLAVSVDLIHGTPGESVEDWRTSLEAAIALAAFQIGSGIRMLCAFVPGRSDIASRDPLVFAVVPPAVRAVSGVV